MKTGSLGIRNLQANMTRFIDEIKCSRCGVCVLECPNQAFVMTDDSMLLILNHVTIAHIMAILYARIFV